MSLPNTNITLGAPPLLWSDVSDALKKVNENFDSVAAALGVAGITPINFETLDTSLKPTSNGLYSLGDTTHKWTGVFTESYNTANPLNGLWAGPAQIKGIGYTVNLPANSTIGGDPLTGIGTSLIIDPDKTFFKSVQVDNGNQVVANNFADTLNLNSGTAIQLVVDSGAESITINNAGVTSLTAGVGISVSAASGNITVTNNGVRSLTSTTALPVGRVAGAGINIDASSGDGIKITNTGVLTITSGVGITVATDTATGEVQIINSAPAGSAFSYVEINGDADNRIAADLVTDVLSVNSGLGITLTKNVANDSFTIAVNPVFDLTGNVLGDVTGNVSGNAGTVTNGVYTTGDQTIGGTKTFSNTITGSITGNAGTVTNGVYTTGDQTIGGTKTFSNTITGSITGNAGTVTNGVYTSGSYSDPSWLTISKSKVGLSAVENTALSTWAGSSNITTVGTLGSLAVTNGVSAASFTGNIFTSLIDSSDSSAITITPITIFSSDVIVENELSVAGSRVINVNQIKSIVAASTNFADFQARIAAL